MSFSSDLQELELLENIKIFFNLFQILFLITSFSQFIFPTCFIHNAFLHRLDHLSPKALVKRFLGLLIPLQKGALC